ncbi:hypothetical protein HDU76_004702 [Blyttiomyces sp. JEL0837]|nr:hypothetical protein HDU76_004702 [Blyttiomyces sp. JEL0837]
MNSDLRMSGTCFPSSASISSMSSSGSTLVNQSSTTSGTQHDPSIHHSHFNLFMKRSHSTSSNASAASGTTVVGQDEEGGGQHVGLSASLRGLADKIFHRQELPSMDDWGYSGRKGPKNWHRIPGLQIGSHQSPLDFINDDLLHHQSEFTPLIHWTSRHDNPDHHVRYSLHRESLHLLKGSEADSHGRITTGGCEGGNSGCEEHEHHEHVEGLSGKKQSKGSVDLGDSRESYQGIKENDDNKENDDSWVSDNARLKKERDEQKFTLSKEEFEDEVEAVHVKNTGTTIKIIMPEHDYGKRVSGAEEEEYYGGFVVFKHKRFYMRQFHFHAPSEHKVRGRAYDMEVHFVHSSDDGDLLVVGAFMVDAQVYGLQAVGFFDGLYDHLPETKKSAEQHVSDLPLEQAAAFIQSSPSFYVYEGSLTTPPLIEGVQWIVASKPIPVSKGLIKVLKDHMPRRNVRPAFSSAGYPVQHVEMESDGLEENSSGAAGVEMRRG